MRFLYHLTEETIMSNMGKKGEKKKEIALKMWNCEFLQCTGVKYNISGIQNQKIVNFLTWRDTYTVKIGN